MRETVLIASDHNGFKLKTGVCKWLVENGFTVCDMGPYSDVEKVDYVDFANLVAKPISLNKELKGVLICGTGIGMSIAANRYVNVFASHVRDVFTAEKTKEHNKSNVLVLGSWLNSIDEIKDILECWFKTSFGEGRHTQRVQKLSSKDSNIVVVPGVFDILKLYHVELFKFAKNFGKVVVAINSDDSDICINRGLTNTAKRRRKLIENISSVDEVIEFDGNVKSLLNKMNVTHVIKGSEYTEEQVRANDGVPNEIKVILFPMKNME